MKLEKLTAEQEAIIPIVRDEWVKSAIGSGSSIDRKKAIDGINFVYEISKLEKPKMIFIVDSLLGAQLLANILPTVLPKLHEQLAGLPNKEGDSVRDSVLDSVGDSVWDSVRASVWDSVRASVRDFKYFDNNGYGYDSGWLAFYDFFRRIGVLDNDKFNRYVDFVQSGVWECISYQYVSIICKRPNTVKKNEQGRLHCSSGPAVMWDDGWENYCLNGVRVTKEIVMTPAEKLDPQMVIKEKNAEVRRELVRKIGVERLVMKLGAKLIDKQGDYELLDLNLGEDRYRPYLKMKNPSIATWHIEGVAPECRSVQDAINWRRSRNKNLQWSPEALT